MSSGLLPFIPFLTTKCQMARRQERSDKKLEKFSEPKSKKRPDYYSRYKCYLRAINHSKLIKFLMFNLLHS